MLQFKNTAWSRWCLHDCCWIRFPNPMHHGRQVSFKSTHWTEPLQLSEIILLVHPGLTCSVVCFGHEIHWKQQKSSDAPWWPERGTGKTKWRCVIVSMWGLKRVQDGVVHLDQHSQMDRQAGLAVLCSGCTRQPGQGVVLLQYKPVHEKYAALYICCFYHIQYSTMKCSKQS